MADSTISTKQYLLDHVLYEMEMYLYSYRRIHHLQYQDQLEFNVLWNSHNVALRNLMDFFGISGHKGKGEIDYNSFSFAEVPPNRKNRQNYYGPLSQAITHITVQRFRGSNGRQLDEVLLDAREKLFPEIREYICRFINHLETENNITYTYQEDEKDEVIDISKEMDDQRIQGILASVKQLICASQAPVVGFTSTVTTC